MNIKQVHSGSKKVSLNVVHLTIQHFIKKVDFILRFIRIVPRALQFLFSLLYSSHQFNRYYHDPRTST